MPTLRRFSGALCIRAAAVLLAFGLFTSAASAQQPMQQMHATDMQQAQTIMTQMEADPKPKPPTQQGYWLIVIIYDEEHHIIWVVLYWVEIK
jgi:hypothetical protein